MDDRGQGKTLWHRSIPRAVVLLALWSGVSGCVGPNAVRYTRLRYNEVIRDTNDQQLLLNIVRLRYADSPVFIDLPNITSQFEVAGRGNYLGGYGNQTPGRASLGFGELTLRDTPTLSYHPREGREIAKALLTPLSSDLFIVVNAGANLEQLLLMTINDINDVPNAPRATTLIPRVPDDNALFLRGIRLLASLRDRDATELAFGTNEESEDSSDPIPRSSVQGRDLLNAARDGYVYRNQGEGQMTLLKREKGLFLRVRPPYVHSPEMEEVARIFRLTPGLSRYRIKSELTEEVNRAPEPAGRRHDLYELAVGLADHDLSLQGRVRPRRARPERGCTSNFGPGRRALRLDAGHRRKLLRARAETPPARRGGGRSLPGILVLHRPERRELAGSTGHPRDPLRTPRVGRQERRPAAHPPARRVSCLQRRYWHCDTSTFSLTGSP